MSQRLNAFAQSPALFKKFVEFGMLLKSGAIEQPILRLVESSGQPTAGGIGIGFPITRQDIAEMTGTTLHTVSRLLSDWRQRGIVEQGQRKVRCPGRNTAGVHGWACRAGASSRPATASAARAEASWRSCWCRRR